MPELSIPSLTALLDVERIQAWLATDGLRIVVTVLGAFVVRWLLHRAIDRVVATMTSKAGGKAGDATAKAGRGSRVFAAATGASTDRHALRMRTLGSLLRSVVTFVVFGVALITVLDLLGIPIGPLLASASVAGVALGFGAQSLVKDFLAGVFMMAEDQYGVGDFIDMGEASGTVEEVTLRVTKLRDFEGVTWYVRNGEVLRIGNRSQASSIATVDIAVSYREQPERVIAIIKDVGERMAKDPEWESKMLAPPSPIGVESVAHGTMLMRTFVTTAPNQHYGVVRELRERVKVAFDEAGVELPPVLPYGPGERR